MSGTPIIDITIDIILEKHRGLLRKGAVLVDERSWRCSALAFYLEHSIRDARLLPGGQPRVVSRKMQFVEIDERGNAHEAGYARISITGLLRIERRYCLNRPFRIYLLWKTQRLKLLRRTRFRDCSRALR